MTGPKTTLVISNRDDLHASAVIELLNEGQQPVFRLNTEDLLTSVGLALSQGPEEDALTIRQLDTGRELRAADIGAVWFRRPAPPVPNARLDEVAHTIVASEARWFLRWVYAWLQDKWWLASPWAIDHAAAKPLQLQVAIRSGLKVPRTLYSNDPATVGAFCRDCSRIAIKPIRETGYEEHGRFRPFYTAIEPAEAFAALSGSFDMSVNFLQEAVDKAYELRVTWVDGKAIPVRIHSQSGPAEAREDWRTVDWRDLSHDVVALPSEVEAALGRYMKAMGLRFGAIDFIVTPAGDHVFLECNPNGQWLWLDEAAQAGVARAIADALVRASTSAAP
jgi:glutathione synthase/RimK-type ligase-like ATP-grasp enzyme